MESLNLKPYVENVRRRTAELKRRNAEATERARRDLPKLVEVIRRRPVIRKAYLFGSLAKGLFHPEADIDIAVEGLDFDERVELQLELQGLTGFRVDVRDLDSSPGFRGLVEFYGELFDAGA